jgi:pimeloyl-ACP methyl ester carboxylesterase
MRRKVIRVLALTLIEFSARAAGFPTTTVFLVPGLANSTIAPYFSVDGQRILSESGLRVVELISLTSLGGFEANGKRVRDILDKECNKRNWIVAHSAGGFFSMAAIKESRCRITGLMTVGSPLAGSIIARDVFKTPIASLYRWARAYLWFESQLFDDLLPDEVEKFYKHVEPFPYCFRLLTVAGVQPQPSG